MRLILVVGARPNFVKAAPLVRAFERAGMDLALVHTGQHQGPEMSDPFFAELGLPVPRWTLGVGGGSHAVQTGKAMIGMERVLIEERPDALLVVGDVNSTLAAALAASKLNIPIVHMEAGLRSHDMTMPEEINRIVTDRLAAMLLAPSRDAIEHLSQEGVEERRMHFVGNVMAEAVLTHRTIYEPMRAWEERGLKRDSYVLATIHRAENTRTRERSGAILEALERAPLRVLLPAHPRTRALLDDGFRNVMVCPPVGYLEMLSLEAGAAAIVTDSGGVQEEACVIGTPCVTVRRTTERMVTVTAGANRMATAGDLLEKLNAALHAPRGWEIPERWDDRVSERVVEAIASGVIPLDGY